MCMSNGIPLEARDHIYLNVSVVTDVNWFLAEGGVIEDPLAPLPRLKFSHLPVIPSPAE